MLVGRGEHLRLKDVACVAPARRPSQIPTRLNHCADHSEKGHQTALGDSHPGQQ